MSQIPDYSQFNLKQLYNELRSIDGEQNPERLTAVTREIELKRSNYGTVFVRDPIKITPLLLTVRCLVGIEYGIVALMVLYSFMACLINLIFVGCLETFMFVVVLFIMCSIGVGPMRSALEDISDEAVFEAAWLGAVGLAPVSAFTYYVLSGVLLEWWLPNFRRSSDLSLVVCLPLGFYMPFVLLTYWVKYKFRTDEF